jgi:hypothetical protein
MSKSNATENDYVKFEANAVSMPSYGSTLQINLHTADPGEAGTATTSAPTYTGYAAITKARDATALTICDVDGTPNASGSAYKNATDFVFAECTGGGPENVTHISISVVATGQILRSTALNAPLSVSNLITPYFPAGSIIFAED